MGIEHNTNYIDSIPEVRAVQRNSSIELLRIIAMLMIVTGHAILYGNNNITNRFNGEFIGFIRTTCSVAVDCYIIISGYFMISQKKFKIGKLVRLWIEIFTYSTLIYIILCLTGYLNFNLPTLARRALPISSNTYWFMSVYFGVYLFSPFLNKLIKALDKQHMKYFVILNIFVFSLWKTFIPFAKTWNPEGGNGLFWFFCLYTIGAYIRLYGNKKFNPYRCIGLFFSCMLLMHFGGRFIEELSVYVGNGQHGSWIINSYTSILMVICAISLFLTFRDIKIQSIKTENAICRVASSCLGVYLIHEQPEMRTIIWDVIISFNDKWYLIFEIIAVSLMIFCVCIIVEKIRNWAYKTTRLSFIEYIADKALICIKSYIA